MLIPEHVRLDGVQAGGSVLVQAVLPVVARNAVQVYAARHVSEGLAVFDKGVVHKVDGK